MDLVIKKFDELNINELYEILKVRCNVFVVEQNCPYLDMDDKDKYAYHMYLKSNQKIKAYLRIITNENSSSEVTIGRVLTTERGKGYSKIILNEAIKFSKEKLNVKRVIINAQTYAKKVYEKFGFKPSSDEFLEDNIPHIQMLLEIH